jgi:hypothetical protein
VKITFYLNDVNFQEANTVNKSISYLFFKKYIFTVDKKSTPTYIKKSAKDLYLWELLTFDASIFFPNNTSPQIKTLKNKFNEAWLTHGKKLFNFMLVMEFSIISFSLLIFLPLLTKTNGENAVEGVC